MFSIALLDVLETKPAWTQTVVKTISVGNYLDFFEFNPCNENINILNQISDDVSVISSTTNTLIKTLNAGDEPFEAKSILVTSMST